MDALVMCGGRGTRLDSDREKPLVEVGGRPLVDRVRDALADSAAIERVIPVTSPAAPRTREYLDRAGPSPPDGATIDAPGEGYVADLSFALDRVERPVLTVAADLPLLSGPTIDRVCAAHDSQSMTACVPADLKRRLGVSIERETTLDGRPIAPSGVNVVAGNERERRRVFQLPRLAVNVNHSRDWQIAEALLDSEVLP